MNPFLAIRLSGANRRALHELSPVDRLRIWPLVVLRANWIYTLRFMWIRDLLRWFRRTFVTAFWLIVALTGAILLVNRLLVDTMVATERESDIAATFVLFGFVSGATLGVWATSVFFRGLRALWQSVNDFRISKD